jgi:hypothetical protein
MYLPSNDFLEFLNLFLTLQGLIAIIVFVRYLLDLWPNWWKRAYSRLALGFTVFFTGFTLLRFWTFLTRVAQVQGFYNPPEPGTLTYHIRPIFLISALIMTAGLICVLREISVWKSNWGWTFVMIACGLISAGVAWFL